MNFLEKLKNELTKIINKIDFVILKENYNKLFIRNKHIRIIYEDDEYNDLSFFDKEIYGDDVFLKNELIKQIQYTIDNLKKAPFDEMKKINLLFDEFTILIFAIGVSLGLQPENYKNMLYNKIITKN